MKTPKTIDELRALKHTNPFEDIDMWVDGDAGLPKIGSRCLFQLKGGWMNRKGKKIVPDFMAYGYRCTDASVYLPLHRKKLSTLCVKRWRYVPGECFWNGTGRFFDEFDEVGG